MSAAIIEYSFSQVKGTAIAFTPASFATYVDEHLRNADDAVHGVLVRHAGDNYEALESACRANPSLAREFVDLLAEDAGYARESAILTEPLREETPPGVLRLAGLSVEDADRLRVEAGPRPQRIVIVRDADRRKLFACVLRADEVAYNLVSEARANRKGFGKACVSASLASIVWSDKLPEQVFERYPAIPVLALFPHLVNLGEADKVGTFRRR